MTMDSLYDHEVECDVSIWLDKQMNDATAPRWLGAPDDIPCQCEKLRACVQRVRESNETWSAAVLDAGRQLGLNAAREAVADDPSDTTDGSEFDEGYVAGRDRALAAIDILIAGDNNG